MEIATLIQAERELAVIVEALSCLPKLAAMTRKAENRKQKAEIRAGGGEEADDDDVDDPRLLPYVVNARGVVDSVICIAAWRLKQLARRLHNCRGDQG